MIGVGKGGAAADMQSRASRLPAAFGDYSSRESSSIMLLQEVSGKIPPNSLRATAFLPLRA